ncbi:mRNA-capping enzyme subunit beta [Toensbergia leucococca]|nr:mRNA-capping enzyme subunit beta [Toensbergia leucococca]
MLKEIPNPAQARMSAPLATYPTQNQHSLPGTPLGPPSTFGRLSSGLQREIPGPGDQQRSFSDSSHSRQQKAAPSPGRESSGSWAASPTVYGPRHSQSITETYASDHDRERSLSVSPKTRLPSQGNSEAMDITQNTPHENNGQVTPVKREETVDALENPNSDQPNAIRGQDGPASRVVDGTLNPPQSNQQSAASYGYAPDQRQESLSSHSPTPIPLSRPFHFTANSDQSTSQGLPTPGSSSATPSRPQPSTPRLPSNHQIPPLQSTPTSPDAMHTPSGVTTIAPPTPATQHIVAGQQSTNPAGLIGLPEQPKRKRKRYDEIPMFARKASRTNPTVPADPQPAPQFPRPVKQKSPSAKHRSSQSPPQHPSIRSSNANGHSAPKNEVLLPQVQRGFANQGSLGPWEPSILNTAPLDDVTHSLSEILFNEVVRRDDVGPGSAVGGVGGVGRGAVLEIEAKIGQLIDRNTNDRIRLPVMSECIVSKGDPNLRVNFKSSMTESQHRSMNGFLNKALLDSQPSKSDSSANPRIPMTYVHTRECDSFYDLSQAGLLSLPASIRNQLDQRHPRVKVRITTDQKTGKVLAKIVKARVTDVDVYSPRTPFDWRVSVNLEMDWDGDMKDLVESKNGQKRADRNKDRVSYRHQSYQIDLTQVTPSDTSSKPEKEHELEVEVSSSEVRKQGLLFKNNQANRYNDLIRGFVDNVRTLARHCHV